MKAQLTCETVCWSMGKAPTPNVVVSYHSFAQLLRNESELRIPTTYIPSTAFPGPDVATLFFQFSQTFKSPLTPPVHNSCPIHHQILLILSSTYIQNRRVSLHLSCSHLGPWPPSSLDWIAVNTSYVVFGFHPGLLAYCSQHKCTAILLK